MDTGEDRLRVLHVVEVRHGGVVSYVRDVAAEQRRRGCDVQVLAPPGVFDAPEDSIHTWDIDRRKPAQLASAARELRHLVRQVSPDVTHLHSFLPGLLGRAGRLPRANGAAVVYQPHAWAFDAVGVRGVGTAIGWWERVAARRGHTIACVSHREVEEGQRRRIPVHESPIGSPVDTDHFHPVDEHTRAQWRQKLEVSKPRLIVCIGRICRQKGQDLLLDAWARDPVPDTELVLVGPGDVESAARGLPSEWSRSMRAVGAADDVRPWLWAADLVILPSRYEANSLALGEALACGRPVVATDVGGARDAIGGVAGCVVDQGAVEQLVHACRLRLDNPEMLARETEGARDRAVDLFAVPAVVDRLEGLYSTGFELAGRRR